jgi:predicted lipoprotein with Yx(FWY)xxD motif
MNRFLSTALALLLSLFAVTVLAQEGAGQATVKVSQSDQYGAYLTDGDGRTLYLFLNEEMAKQGSEQMTKGVRKAAVSCTGDCLAAWPAFTAKGDVQAAEGVNADLLYTAEFDGRTHVVYNGWPLFYFVRDKQPGQINGQGIESFGGEWYIVGPEGHKVEGEEQAAGGEQDGEGDVAGGGGAEGQENGQDAPAGEGGKDGAAGEGGEAGQEDGSDTSDGGNRDY